MYIKYNIDVVWLLRHAYNQNIAKQILHSCILLLCTSVGTCRIYYYYYSYLTTHVTLYYKLTK